MSVRAHPTPIGELGASVVLKTLRGQAFRSSNRHIVDYLPTEVADDVFAALLELADTAVTVPVSLAPDECIAMRALSAELDGFDVVPYLVGPPGVGAGTNCGTEGFASYLRDYYAVDANKPRLLVVFTPSGIETQKSAQDALADAKLLSLEALLAEVCNRALVPLDSPIRAVADVYRAYQSEQAEWPRVVEAFEKFVDTVGDLPPERQGEHLPMLGCFVRDAQPNFVDGDRVHVLEGKDERRRSRGETRLFDNALLHEFLSETFQNPIADPAQELAELFDDDPSTAEAIAEGGLDGLEQLDLQTFDGMAQKKAKRKRNAFDTGSLSVEGARFHRLAVQGNDKTLAVTTVSSFRVTVELARPINLKKEKAQLIAWDYAAQRIQPRLVSSAVDGSTSVAFDVPVIAGVPFSVCRLALTKGPRSVRAPIDAILVAVYADDVEETAVEEGLRLDLEHQAWIVDGDPSFLRYSPVGSVTGEVLHQVTADPLVDDSPLDVHAVSLADCSLKPRVVEDSPEVGEYEDENPIFVESMIELACTTTRRGHATTRAMQAQPNYLDAIDDIRESGDRFAVDFGGNEIRHVWAGGTEPTFFQHGQAVGQLIMNPEAFRVEHSRGEWRSVTLSVASIEHIDEFLARRRDVLDALRQLAAQRVSRFRRAPDVAAVPLSLLPLHTMRDKVEALLAAWSDAVEQSVKSGTPFGAAHDVLLQTDTLRTLGNENQLKSLVVLPTHPWLLSALLQFQERFAQNVATAQEVKRSVNPSWKFDLQREEVEQMIPSDAMERWYVWQSGQDDLVQTTSPPFHWRFVPAGDTSLRAPMEYVARAIANKVTRYLRMHPHLRDERRTLRIGFLNAGDGEQVLEGLKLWLRNAMAEHAGRVRELPMAQIPALDVLLFASAGDVRKTGTTFERFFKAQVTAADEDVIRQALLARLRYRYCDTLGPKEARDSVHICFLHGLVDTEHQQGKTGLLDEWWDGAFCDGLLSTYLRRALPGEGVDALRSRRGLWVAPDGDGMRGALAKLLSLQRGCRDSDLSLAKGLYWECSLPGLKTLKATYERSDWVVHLDRELSLEVFRQGSADDQPTIIEYSDQAVPQSPGYDTITATRHAGPYREQLGEILTTADLDLSTRSAEARRSANQLLDDINVLSGSWALDFLLGSIADQRTSTRLKGNVGAALAFRWLLRSEAGAGGSALVNTNVGDVVPVYVSLEDLLRATPAAGLARKHGLVHRYTNEVDDVGNRDAARWCDDLLVFYLTPSVHGDPSRIYGRVIEVKFGKSAKQYQEKAVAQVRGTWQLLRDRLSGSNELLDAPFRHKQLSLLIKAQLEQAVAMGLYAREVYEHLNVPALSTNLATGNYHVDYTLGHAGQHVHGDAFLLCTGESTPDATVDIEVVDGVRIITVPRNIVEWLAFEPADSPTLVNIPPSTMPRLGKYTSVETSAGVSARRERLRASEETNEEQPSIAVAEPEAATPEAPSAPASPLPEVAAHSDKSTSSNSQRPSSRNSVGQSSLQDTDSLLSLDEAIRLPVKTAPYPDSDVVAAVERLEKALKGHKVALTSPPSARETARGPRLLRVYVRLEPGESINSIRRTSEDIARVVGTATSDIHITNVPERHAVGLDLPLPGLTYSVSFDELTRHRSFESAKREMTLGFCAGIDVTGHPLWTDLAKMPHMLVAGTTGSGKTVFLRNVILTLLLNNGSDRLVLRMSSSKPMDFRIFTKAPHARDREMAKEPAEALALATELVDEMDRRYSLIDDAFCDNISEYNQENPDAAVPYIVAVFDEYAEMIASFSQNAERDSFERAIGRLAQKARAAGIHLVVCMQRPDANALKGAIKANILHRFALKLPQNQDSRIILDENGAETLLGQGDLLYKDANNQLSRLQVPFLENSTLKHYLQEILAAADG